MKTSPLLWWYDKGDLFDSLKAAVKRFKDKSKQDANTVWFNNREKPGDEVMAWIEKQELTLKTGKYVLKQHFRVGRERSETEE